MFPKAFQYITDHAVCIQILILQQCDFSFRWHNWIPNLHCCQKSIRNGKSFWHKVQKWKHKCYTPMFCAKFVSYIITKMICLQQMDHLQKQCSQLHFSCSIFDLIHMWYTTQLDKEFSVDTVFIRNSICTCKFT